MEQYRKSPRAAFLDYNAGDFFVTICTKNKECFFGEIRNGEMFLSKLGQFVKNQLEAAGKVCHYVEVPVYVVMPNHIHLYVCISTSGIGLDSEAICQRAPDPAFRAESTCSRSVPLLSRYINSLKGVVTKFARVNNIEFSWQSRYHDHCIRNQSEANGISEYILNNVIRWDKDCFNPKLS
ncbi:MAG: transposase [Muribaculaceae bacterium]|nr:transposase [Muribaculaceae bacterium]